MRIWKYRENFFKRDVVSRRRKDKIKFSFENFLTTLNESEQVDYLVRFAPLRAIMEEVDGDTEIMARAKAYDAEHGADIFAEAVNMKVYCIACQKVQCDCCL